jgi:hypothetical protein
MIHNGDSFVFDDADAVSLRSDLAGGFGWLFIDCCRTPLGPDEIAVLTEAYEATL